MKMFIGILRNRESGEVRVFRIDTDDAQDAYERMKTAAVDGVRICDWQDLDRVASLAVYPADYSIEVDNGVEEMFQSEPEPARASYPVRVCTYRCTSCDRETKITEAATGFPERRRENVGCCTYHVALLTLVERMDDPSWDVIKKCYARP